MSEDENKPDAQETAEATPEAAPEQAANVECSGSPTSKHDMFHNEGTDETYCRYCGKT